MALDILITTNRITRDPTGREFIRFLQEQEAHLNLGSSILYYDFPTYSDYETVSHKPDALFISRDHGIIAIRFVDDPTKVKAESLGPLDESLGQFCSILIGRLLKSKVLRRDRATLRFAVTPLILFTPASSAVVPDLDSEVVQAFQGFGTYLKAHVQGESLDDEALS